MYSTGLTTLVEYVLHLVKDVPAILTTVKAVDQVKEQFITLHLGDKIVLHQTLKTVRF